MFEFATCIGIGGLFAFGLGVTYFAWVCFMYIVYKRTGGKMKFREYVKHW